MQPNKNVPSVIAALQSDDQRRTRRKFVLIMSVCAVIFLVVLGLSAIILFSTQKIYPSEPAITAVDHQKKKTPVTVTPAAPEPTPQPAPTTNVKQLDGEPASHAALPAAVPRTPKPTVIIDSSQAPEFDTWLNTKLKPIIESWYPVFADMYAHPDYQPHTSLTIRVDPKYDGVAYASGNTIVFSTDYFTTRLYDLPGAMLHEATHVIQHNPKEGVANTPGWIIEGVADYTRDYVYKDRPLRLLGPSEVYTGGYSPAAYLLAHAQELSPNFIHDVTMLGRSGNYDDSFFVQRTGKTIEQLWTETKSANQKQFGNS